MSKLTPWFPADVKPVRVGIYERRYRTGIYKCHFDGRVFSCADDLVQSTVSDWQNLPWRGLAEPPK